MQLRRFSLRLLRACAISASLLVACRFAAQSARAQQTPFTALQAQVPASAEQLAGVDVDRLRAAARNVDDYTYRVTQVGRNASPAHALAAVRTALDVKRYVDELLDGVMKLRTGVVGDAPSVDAAPRNGIPAGGDGPDEPVRAAARGWLRTAHTLIDLSARLRYLQNDVIRTARERLTDPASRERMADLFLEFRSTVGAAQSIGDLETYQGPSYQEKLLRLVARSGQTSLLPDVLEYAADVRRSAPMRLFAAEIVRTLGVPQPPRANPAEELPDPPVTPVELYELVASIDGAALDDEGRSRRDELLAWLDVRRKKGVVDDSYRIGSFEVRPGDWLLMRNPSPYNLFTDLSPGLFTHVGVVAAETGADGIRRFVIVDVPERGTRVPAVNVEIYLERTLHYVFLRDNDAAAARAMGGAAAAVIDNPSQFDLNFRNDRILPLAKKPLDELKVHTYCAGLLLLCALQTDVDRHEYFPLTERQAAGHTIENVAKMGLSLGADFISPSGPLFSHRMSIVGRREAMYDPRRDVEEAVFDHFAACLMNRKLQADGSWYHDLQLQLARASQGNPLLSQALAAAAGVSAETDLVSAAKAALVVETLDQVAQGASRDLETARAAVRGVNPANAVPPVDGRRIPALRARHADLAAALSAGRMSPRDVRLALVRYYIAAGQAEIERRFFGAR
jgi:hypothetical protein